MNWERKSFVYDNLKELFIFTSPFFLKKTQTNSFYVPVYVGRADRWVLYFLPSLDKQKKYFWKEAVWVIRKQTGKFISIQRRGKENILNLVMHRKQQSGIWSCLFSPIIVVYHPLTFPEIHIKWVNISVSLHFKIYVLLPRTLLGIGRRT